MIQFKIKSFFNLENFKHKELFSSNIAIWNLIEHLEDYLNNWFKKYNYNREIKGEVDKGAFLKGDNIFIDEGSKIEAGAMIIGPTVIGKNCYIRHNAYIRGKTIISDSCVIGNSTEIKNSIILANTKASHFNYIGDSILGSNINLGAGVKLANLRLDGKDIKLFLKNNKIITTKLKKLGSILGDGVVIGCNSVCNPGTILEKDCFVHPLTLVSGYYQSGSIIK